MAYKLIIESGSTKTDWVIITPDKNHKFATQGMNPSANDNLFDLTKEGANIINHAPAISNIHYFGAGVIDKRTRSIIKNWLGQYFEEVKDYQIENDILGAAKATAGDNEGIINILGTGSNSCVYNGSQITDNIPALGYTLSNEGGGSKIGGELVKAYFYKRLPTEVNIEFETKYNLSKSEVIKQLYKRENPTAFLAGFAKFFNETKHREWRKNFLFPIFQEFVDIRIKQYSEYLRYDLYFVGSIAYFYADVIRDVLQYNGLKSVSIIQKPIDGLVDYFK